jgi:DNA mismatch repair protein MutS
VRRARAVLGTLEGEHRMVPGAPPPLEAPPGQLALFADSPPDPVVEDLKAMDLDSLTPLQALNRLADLKRRASGGPSA